MNLKIRIPPWALMTPVVWLVALSASCHGSQLFAPPGPQGSISIWRTDAALQATNDHTRSGPSHRNGGTASIADPLERVNRISFYINDRLYFLVVKPVATGYAIVVPHSARVGIRNFFSNLVSPVRVASCLLQFKFKGAGTETIRFLVNTTLGVAGFVDTAKREFGIERRDEDFGQTLGFYGIGPVFYINWPLWGPSSLRDTVGIVVDFFLNPWNYFLRFPVLVNIALGAYDRLNSSSLVLGEYEAFKRAALDPYVAMRNAYFQYRQNKIRR
ncbi:MAG: VacJ family lipoprotein [Deltaproteobacteria bacterium]|nr:VacJ family lipoprotein [Deltaproteobacteria bacterium]MBW2120435.1 VacJ family lipoprotein [Deltaproteobacteria bacterium]